MSTQNLKMSIKKKVAFIILVLLGLSLIYIMFGEVRQAVATHRAAGKVAAAKLRTESQADQKMSQFESQLISSGIAASKIASSKVDVCYVNHDDEGWFAVNWYQDC